MFRVPSASHAMMGVQGLCLYLTIQVRLHIAWCLPRPDTFLLKGMRFFFSPTRLLQDLSAPCQARFAACHCQ